MDRHQRRHGRSIITLEGPAGYVAIIDTAETISAERVEEVCKKVGLDEEDFDNLTIG